MLTKLVAMVYRAYDDKGLDIPYFRTLMTIVLCIIIHMAHIALLFDLSSNFIMPIGHTTNKWQKWVFGSIYIVGLVFIISLVFNEQKLEKLNVTDKEIERTKKILPIYLLLTMALLFGLLIKKGISQGKIHF